MIVVQRLHTDNEQARVMRGDLPLNPIRLSLDTTYDTLYCMR